MTGPTTPPGELSAAMHRLATRLRAVQPGLTVRERVTSNDAFAFCYYASLATGENDPVEDFVLSIELRREGEGLVGAVDFSDAGGSVWLEGPPCLLAGRENVDDAVTRWLHGVVVFIDASSEAVVERIAKGFE